MREMIEIDLSPRTAWLDSVFNKHLTVDACFSEFFDNAFDQNATAIEVTIGPDSITVLDDGNGIANMEHMLAFSEQPATPRPRVGRYGVGAKYGAINLGTQLTIDTRHGLTRQHAFVDWQAIRDTKSWKVLIEAPRASHGSTFTKLTITHTTQGISRRLDVAKPKLARTYRPALLAGKRILINGEELQASPLPKFKKKPLIIEDEFNGKHFRLTFGIRADDSPHKGYDVAYMYRLIIPNDTTGFGEYSPLRVYGYLELLNDAVDWSLTELKSGAFGEREDLYEFLLPKIEDILIEAQKQTDSLVLENAATVLNERLKPLGSIGKGPKRRDPPEHTRGQYKHHDPPEHSPRRPKPRSLDERLMNTGFKVDWDEEEEGKIGEVTYSGNTGIIHLNPTYALIGERTDEAQTDAYLVVCCMLIVMNWHETQEEERPDVGNLFAHDASSIEQVSKLVRAVTIQTPDEANPERGEQEVAE
jgi:hypothetical protein